MTDDDAVARIEAAIRRIAAATQARRREEETLRRRHAALRDEVARALTEIDALATRGTG